MANTGVASWYDFAVAIAEEAVQVGRLEALPRVEPIPTDGYPTRARRPGYSVLDTTGTWAALGHPLPHWRAALRETLTRMDTPAHA